MRFESKSPARQYQIEGITLHDCGTMRLGVDEQITFATESGAEYDVARKDWGFYATPSLNGRLGRFGLRPALAANANGKFFILLLERGREDHLNRYLQQQQMRVICWLDDQGVLNALEIAAKPYLGPAAIVGNSEL
jgi:hypothetical protein